jgi:hypothetical protein
MLACERDDKSSSSSNTCVARKSLVAAMGASSMHSCVAEMSLLAHLALLRNSDRNAAAEKDGRDEHKACNDKGDRWHILVVGDDMMDADMDEEAAVVEAAAEAAAVMVEEEKGEQREVYGDELRGTTVAHTRSGEDDTCAGTGAAADATGAQNLGRGGPL